MIQLTGNVSAYIQKGYDTVFFPSNLIVALVSAIIYIIICFKLNFPEKYRKAFRIYSIIIQVSFFVFLVFFSLFIHSTQDNSGLVFFSYGLDIFYTLIALPLLTTLIYLISKWFMTLNDYPIRSEERRVGKECPV